MIRGARTTRRGLRRHDLVGLLEMHPRPRHQRHAYFRQRRIGDHLLRIVGGDAGVQQTFARQIQPADAGVFIDIAQDVGQLQRAAEMMREQDAVVLGEAEHPHRQPSDRAGDAVAIQIERRQIRRPDILRHIHLHAVDDGQEILALETESSNRGDIVAQSRRRLAPVQRVDIVAPLLKRRQPLGARAIGIGDVVDLPAESCRSETSPRAARAAECASPRRTNCRTRMSRNSHWLAAVSTSCAGRRFGHGPPSHRAAGHLAARSRRGYGRAVRAD